MQLILCICAELGLDQDDVEAASTSYRESLFAVMYVAALLFLTCCKKQLWGQQWWHPPLHPLQRLHLQHEHKFMSETSRENQWNNCPKYKLIDSLVTPNIVPSDVGDMLHNEGFVWNI